MCANNFGKNDERNYLVALRKKLLTVDLEEFHNIISNARPLVWFNGEQAKRYNEIIKETRYKQIDEETCLELRKVLMAILT